MTDKAGIELSFAFLGAAVGISSSRHAGCVCLLFLSSVVFFLYMYCIMLMARDQKFIQIYNNYLKICKHDHFPVFNVKLPEKCSSFYGFDIYQRLFVDNGKTAARSAAKFGMTISSLLLHILCKL